MIDIPTVMILGAGASIPYGFPSGRELLLDIYRKTLETNSPFVRRIQGLGISLDHIQNFGVTAYRSMQPSVDAFLEYRTEFLEVGKLTIASELIPCESPTKLERLDKQEWYEYLWRRLSAPPERFSENQIAFLTFNYDRSLEYFLTGAVKHSYGLEDKGAAEVVKAIPIVHLHGQLGALPFFGDQVRAYNQEVTPEYLRMCASEIKIIHETNMENEPQFTRAHELLQWAERVIFLGFGYNPTNVERLKINQLCDGNEIVGSAMGFETTEITTIKERLFRGRLVSGLNHHDCLMFLRYSVSL